RAVGLNAQGQVTYAVVKTTYDALGRVTQSTAYANAMVLADATQSTLEAAIAANADNAHDRLSASVVDLAGREIYAVQATGAGGTYAVVKRAYDALDRETSSTAYATPVGLADFTKATLDAALRTSDKDRTSISVYDLLGRKVYGLEVAARDASGAPT